MHWSTDAPIIDVAKGGHFHLQNIDVSAWGAGLGSAGKLFYLRGVGHSSGIQSMTVRDTRVEAASNNAGLIYSEWGYQPQVLFDSVDMSSQEYTYTYGADVISLVFTNHSGTYLFRNCRLAGGVTVAWHGNEYSYDHKIIFEDCEWVQKESPSDVVTYDSSAVVNGCTSFPPVQFIRCRTDGQYADAYAGGGAATWDATIKWNGQPLQLLYPRQLIVTSGFNGVPQSAAVKILLPVGALITDFIASSPAGTSPDADGGSWVLATTEGSPTTIATATVAGAMSAGYDVVVHLSAPFLCSTTEKARLTITPSNVDSTNPSGVVIVKGYW